MMGEVAIALLPICVFFVLFQICARCICGSCPCCASLVGLVYTYVGLVLFLTGVNVGFMPAGLLCWAASSLAERSWPAG